MRPIVGRLLAAAAVAIATAACGADPTVIDRAEGADEDPCRDDPGVFAYCGDGSSSFDPNDPNLVTFFDAFETWNEGQISKYGLPAAIEGARLVGSTNMGLDSEWASCARYEKGQRWWRLCRRVGASTTIGVVDSG